ncbi:UDP-N-acetylmuramoyl-L-alanyl-D-glutamate--2,6-diaminopimelate ligase, partial [Patescibacteria group bacterium]|nr:UDP-N-acetylmuramoyl-L-alanyl-D-glutamate--2,6-diaminopimelate ligase [Patescibacteria group bacterium]
SAGGGRDKWKRPELGQIASQYSDQIFITNEDPYDEDPLTIANEILAGCQTPSQSPPFQGGEKVGVEIILDRRAAISRALSLAQEGDIVLVLGKGTEQTYVEDSKKIYWDDRVVVREEIKKLLV